MTVMARTIGPAGSGKTTDALETMEKVLATGIADPLRIGFVSFTRAARAEAASRAASKFGGTTQELEKVGWFKTLHAICYRQLGIQPGELLTGSKDDNEWLRNVLGDEKASLTSGRTDDDMMFTASSDQGESSISLALWSAARNRLSPLKELWKRAYNTDARTPELANCEKVVMRYESAKRKICRLDFTDLLMRFAGKEWTGQHDRPFQDVEPLGDDPGLPVWFLDEAQDTGILAWLVFQRLIRFSQWAYLSGDAWQSIYNFAGADGRIFGECQVAKEKVLPVSYRCPSNILKFSDDIMLRAGHALRPCKAHRQGGEIVRTSFHDALDSVRADQNTLVIARTNDYAKMAANYLDEAGIPWKPTKGGGGYNAPAKAAGIQAIIDFRNGKSIDGLQIHRILDLFPVFADGARLFEHGAKSFYEDKENQEKAHKIVPLKIECYADAGMTRAFRDVIASGKYVDILDKPAAKLARAAEIHGVDSVVNPKVRVGTAHSCKGMESDHVVVVNRIPYPTQQAIEDDEGMDEERRIWYTATSRAKEILTIAEMEKGEPFPEL